MLSRKLEIRILRILHYLSGTVRLGLRCTGREPGRLEARTDSSFDDWLDYPSTGSYLMSLLNDPTAWKSYRQHEVTQLTAKAECRAMSNVCREPISVD